MPLVIDRKIDFSTFKYRIEMHSHSWNVSQCSLISPVELVNIYHQMGYDGIVLTNHLYGGLPAEESKEVLDNYVAAYYEALEEGNKLGIKVYFGAEIFIKGVEIEADHLFYGITPEDIRDIYPMIEKGLEYLRENYKNDKMVIIQAHPFRGKSTANPTPMVDGIETMNTHFNHNSRSVLAAIAANENPEYITIAGSDCHCAKTAGGAAILTESLPEDSVELAAILKTKRVLHEFSGTITIPPSFNYDK